MIGFGLHICRLFILAAASDQPAPLCAQRCLTALTSRRKCSALKRSQKEHGRVISKRTAPLKTFFLDGASVDHGAPILHERFESPGDLSPNSEAEKRVALRPGLWA
jgi:hypothetical protein